MRLIWKITIFGCLAFFLASCSSTKGLEKGQQLYMGATIHLRNMVDSSPVRNTALEQELEALLRPQPNGAVLGMPVKLWIYNWGGPPSKKGFFQKYFPQDRDAARHRPLTVPCKRTGKYYRTGWKTKGISRIR